jgi:SAM-dependent methyltransferase
MMLMRRRHDSDRSNTSAATRIAQEASMAFCTAFENANAAEELLNRLHPKTIFLKSLAERSTVLNLGAGDGSLIHFKSYLSPARHDLRFHAYSLDKGAHFDSYDSYELSNWNEQRPSFDGIAFDAIVASHFIEHVNNYESVVSWCLSRLAPGGRLYFEWPSEFSLTAPSRAELKTHGINVQIGNVFDDSTYVQLPDRAKIISQLRGASAVTEQLGFVRFPLLESALFYFFKDKPFSYPLQMAYWSRTRWCQYIVATKG